MRGRSGGFVNREHMSVFSKDGTGILAGAVHLRAACQPARIRLLGLVGNA